MLLGFTQEEPLSKPHPVTLDEDERRKTHMLVVGSPGSGKSKFLEWLIRRDIGNRQGLCLLDIHGSLYQDVKRWLSYNYYLTRDVILLDPSDGEHVKGFNPFRSKKGVEIDVQVEGMVQALLRVWGAENTQETPTLDRVSTLVFTAMVAREIPIYDAFHLIDFDQRRVREDVISSFSEPVIRAAWQQVQNLKRAGEWRDEVLSMENRLFKLARSKAIKRFMGVLDGSFNLDLLDIMNKGKILLVNLKESRNFHEENAKAFAALLLNDLFKTSIMFRDRDQLGYDPVPFYVYLDEWQNFVTPDIKKILAQARKFGMLLVLANQDLSQIEEAFSEGFVNTLMTCTQVKACFGGLNRRDAKRMSEEMLVNQIDLNEKNYEIESTKFWPTYQRDKVYTKSTFGTESVAYTSARASGTGHGDGLADSISSQYVWTPNGWITAQPVATTTTSARSGLATETTSESEAFTYGKTTGSAESEADVPILIPVPFKEVTSRAPYSLEEQIWRWSDRFMEQYQRHCFAKLPGQQAVPMLVPFVQDYFVYNETKAEYERDLGNLIEAKHPSEVDAMLLAQPSPFRPSDKEQQRELGDPYEDEEYFAE
jgi:hypothetical protein